MQIIVSTRHGELSDRQRAMVEEQFGRLSRYEPRVSRVDVALVEEKNRWEVEALAHVDRAEPVHAGGQGGDPRSAVDVAVDHMTRQLKRLRDRHVEHQAPPAGELPEEDSAAP